MNRADILSLARQELNKHNLRMWQVKFIKSKSFAGQCTTRKWDTNPSHSFGLIELSTDYMDVFSDEDIRETILHEIAHALNNPRSKAHGPEWKAIALSIGSNGNRCVRKDAERPPAKYRGVCPNGHESRAHRLTRSAKHNRSCGQCDTKYNPQYRFDWYEGNVLVHSQQKPSTQWDAEVSQLIATLPRK